MSEGTIDTAKTASTHAVTNDTKVPTTTVPTVPTKACRAAGRCACEFLDEFVTLYRLRLANPRTSWVFSVWKHLHFRMIQNDADRQGFDCNHVVRNRDSRLAELSDAIDKDKLWLFPYESLRSTVFGLFMHDWDPRFSDWDTAKILAVAPDLLLETPRTTGGLAERYSRYRMRPKHWDREERAVCQHVLDVGNLVLVHVPIGPLVDIVMGYTCRRLTRPASFPPPVWMGLPTGEVYEGPLTLFVGVPQSQKKEKFILKTISVADSSVPRKTTDTYV